MALSWNLRRVLDRKVWEMMTPAPTGSSTGSFVVTEKTGVGDQAFYMIGVSSVWVYDHAQDAWSQLPNSGLGGTWGAGSCGAFHHYGPSGTATAGTTSTITTNLTINRSLAGNKLRITAGPNAGLERTILSNTFGANSVITVSQDFPIAITTASVYQLLTGRIWVLNAGTPDFGYYDIAMNTWTTTPSVTGIPGTWGTDGRLVATSTGPDYYYVSGTVTSANGTTLTNSTKNWTVNQWANSQVRIVSGTGAGQIRSITSNDATTLTVPAWTIAPSTDSTYVIEGNDDYLYLLGNGAVAMYRYSISGNTWSTISPAVARAAAPTAGMSANWIYQCPDPSWNVENNYLNGRHIYSFRGSAGAALDYYDIATNSWTALTYVPQVETFSTGSAWQTDEGYIYAQKDATGRFFRFDVARNLMIPWSTIIYPDSTAHTGDKIWIKKIVDGDTVIKWIYRIRNNGTELFRCAVIDNETNTTNGGWLIEEI